MRLATLCSITVALLPIAAGAQTQPPLTSYSLTDDGTSLHANPGGLGFVSGFEADYLHNGHYTSGYENGDALLLSAGAGPLALGASWDWQPGLPRAVSLGAALHLGGLGLGAVHRTNSNFGPDTWDVGALLRPARWLSLGGAAINSTRANAGPRLWQMSLGLKPVGEKLEVSTDMRWSECTNASGASCGTSHADWYVTANAHPARGLGFFVQLGFLDSGYHAMLAGLQLDLPNLGVQYAPRKLTGQDAEDLFRVRFSTQRWPAVEVPLPRAVEIDLDKSLNRPRGGPLALVFGGEARDPLAQTIAALHGLAQRRGVKAVVLRTGGLSLGLGKAEELRTAIEELQVNGKKVLFYLESGGDLEYSVAAAADRIFAAPQAILLVNGFSASALFAAAGLDKLGVKAEFFRVGAYKNAPDTFTRSSMSGEQREVESSLLDDFYGRYVKDIAKQRHLEEGRVRALLDKGILKPQEAVEAGLLDGLVYPDQLEEEAGKLLGRKVSLEKATVEPPAVRETRWGPPRKIAVVRVEGDILRGRAPRDPFGAVEIAGSDPIVKRIHEAADDPTVAAIVVRIDSPGGDGNASDLIWRELVRARKEKKKPVIASMGDVAASGGYYVAAGADEIWAEPATVTGSIGVFVGHFDAEELLGKLGINITTLRRGQSADIFGVSRDLTDTERKTLQDWVNAFYDQFLDRVAEARHMKKADVDAVARGRVWTGAQAADRGLVDFLGGLTDALDAAKRRAGISRDEEVDIDDSVEAPVDLTDFAGATALSALPMGLTKRTLRALDLLGEPGTLRAALPCDLEVR